MNQGLPRSKTVSPATGEIVSLSSVGDVDFSDRLNSDSDFEYSARDEVINGADVLKSLPEIEDSGRKSDGEHTAEGPSSIDLSAQELYGGDVLGKLPEPDDKDLESAEQPPHSDASNNSATHRSENLMFTVAPNQSNGKTVIWSEEERQLFGSFEFESDSSIGLEGPDHHFSGSTIRRPSQDKESASVEMIVQEESYLKRKRVFIAWAAGLLAFNNGFLNGATLSGLASPGSKLPALTVTGLTASLSFNGLFLSQGMWEEYGIHLGIILSYFTGCFIAGYTTPNPKPYRLEPTYGPTFILGGIFLLAGGFIASFWEEYGVVAYWFGAAASGIQNGIASRYSANLIRCTVTGTTTDIALVLAQLARGVDTNLDNGIVLSIITINFWLGGVLSFFAARQFMKFTLLANAVMFWMIGLGIIFFLVSELGLSVNAAVSGNWKWRKTMQSLRDANIRTDLSMVDMFDVIDKKQNGEVTPEELLDSLLKAGVKTNLRTVRVLVSYADANNNGTIDRDEWATIVAQVMEGSQFTSNDVAQQISRTASKIRQESNKNLMMGHRPSGELHGSKVPTKDQ